MTNSFIISPFALARLIAHVNQRSLREQESSSLTPIKFKAPESPIMDCYLEDSGTVRLEVVVTGFNPDDVTLSRSGDSFTIEAKSGKAVDGTKVYGRVKRDPFSVAFDCGEMFDLEKMSAEFSNGLLIIRIPEREDSSKKLAKVNVPIKK